MDIVRMKKGEDVNDLAARITKSKTKAEIKRTAQALKRANPQLSGRAVKASRDMLVMVPTEVDTALDPPRATASQAGPTLISRARERVGDASRVIPEANKRMEERAARAVEELKGPEVKRMVSEKPELKRRIPQITERAKERLERIRKEGARQQRSLSEMDEVLESLAGLVSAQPGLGRIIAEAGLAEDKDVK